MRTLKDLELSIHSIDILEYRKIMAMIFIVVVLIMVVIMTKATVMTIIM